MNNEKDPESTGFTEGQHAFIEQAVSKILLGMRPVMADLEAHSLFRSDIEYPTYEDFMLIPALAREKNVDADSIRDSLERKIRSFHIRDEELVIMINNGHSIIDSLFEKFSEELAEEH